MPYKGYKQTEEHKRKIGEANKISIKNYFSIQENRNKQSYILSKSYSQENLRKQKSEALKKYYIEHPEVIEKMSIARLGKPSWNKGKKCSEEWVKKNSEKQKKLVGPLSPNWKGGISKLPYCEKWTKELKEKIREKFDFRCFSCDKTQEEIGRKHDIHHIDYDKEQGCNGKKFELIPLCRSCHARTNGKNNRDYWQHYFIDLLKLYYIKTFMTNNF